MEIGKWNIHHQTEATPKLPGASVLSYGSSILGKLAEKIGIAFKVKNSDGHSFYLDKKSVVKQYYSLNPSLAKQEAHSYQAADRALKQLFPSHFPEDVESTEVMQAFQSSQRLKDNLVGDQLKDVLENERKHPYLDRLKDTTIQGIPGKPDTQFYRDFVEGALLLAVKDTAYSNPAWKTTQEERAKALPEVFQALKTEAKKKNPHLSDQQIYEGIHIALTGLSQRLTADYDMTLAKLYEIPPVTPTEGPFRGVWLEIREGKIHAHQAIKAMMKDDKKNPMSGYVYSFTVDLATGKSEWGPTKWGNPTQELKRLNKLPKP